MEVFSVLWHSLENEKKYSVGVLVYNQNWHFKYNQGLIKEAIEQGFRPFPDMPDIKKQYIIDFMNGLNNEIKQKLNKERKL